MDIIELTFPCRFGPSPKHDFTERNPTHHVIIVDEHILSNQLIGVDTIFIMIYIGFFSLYNYIPRVFFWLDAKGASNFPPPHHRTKNNTLECQQSGRDGGLGGAKSPPSNVYGC